DLTAAVSDLDHAGAIVVIGTELVDESPILDLRVRKAVRRNQVPLVVLTSRPSSLEPNADAVLRHAAGAEEAAIAALVAELTEREGEWAARAGAPSESVRAAAQALPDAGPVVVLWGERVSHGPRGREAVAALLALSRALNLNAAPG